MFKKIVYILLPISILFYESLYTEEIPEDSKYSSQEITNLIDQKKYASAHEVLKKILQKEGIHPFYTCMMVENGLLHYFYQQDYKLFYLKNENSDEDKIDTDSSQNIQIVIMRHPERLLKKVIDQNPDYALTYKLLGDYYNIQYQGYYNLNLTHEGKFQQLEEKIYSYYSQAEKLGINDILMNRWLGEYFLNSHQIVQATKLFRKNVSNGKQDVISLFRLAEISYKNKQYNQTQNYANMALNYCSPTELHIKYKILRLAANAFQELGEYDKFINYINNCIQLIPDIQDGYLDLIKFYISIGEIEKSEVTIQNMILNNPFDVKGYRFIENYIIKSQNFFLADTLFDRILLSYENWDEALANVYWTKGNIAYHQNLVSEAKNYWEISRNYMKKYLPEDSPIIKQVGNILSNGNLNHQ
jgi:hypothetical protein